MQDFSNTAQLWEGDAECLLRGRKQLKFSETPFSFHTARHKVLAQRRLTANHCS